MMKTQSDQLLCSVIRISREDSYFFYFILESHEGMAFYSTLEQESDHFREIEVCYTQGFEQDFNHFLQEIQKSCTLTLQDGPKRIQS